jgi:hypothetical protein
MSEIAHSIASLAGTTLAQTPRLLKQAEAMQALAKRAVEENDKRQKK